MVDRQHLDRAVEIAAEAIWRQDRMDESVGATWAACRFPNHYRALAVAAIGALELTEETRHLEDGYGGVSTNWATGEVTMHSRPATRQTRLATPWRVVGQGGQQTGRET